MTLDRGTGYTVGPPVHRCPPQSTCDDEGGPNGGPWSTPDPRASTPKRDEQGKRANPAAASDDPADPTPGDPIRPSQQKTMPAATVSTSGLPRHPDVSVSACYGRATTARISPANARSREISYMMKVEAAACAIGYPAGMRSRASPRTAALTSSW